MGKAFGVNDMSEDFDDFLIDAQLGIDTTGRNAKFSDAFRYPYEPTSYSVLNRIVEENYIRKEDVLVDYGCGKGRVPIYMNYKVGCRGIGIELISDFVELAEQNGIRYMKGKMKTQELGNLAFVCEAAEKWEVPSDTSCFFFFNPFSIEILRGVMARLLDSFYENPRAMRLFFYYPQDEYIAYLSTVEELCFADEIDCTDLFPEKDARNRVMIFEFV